jgi:hypothetical protein
MSKSILSLIPESVRADLIKEIISELSPAELRKAIEEKDNNVTDEDIKTWAEKERAKEKS